MIHQQKRSLVSLERKRFADLAHNKRPKTDVSLLSSKEKKEKFSERISALQVLVSPYGKSDTASILHESMEYIKFLHEQVKVLSAPYMYVSPSSQSQQKGIEDVCGLRSKGLCLVPTSLIEGVASSNGADIWAPTKTDPTGLNRPISDY